MCTQTNVGGDPHKPQISLFSIQEKRFGNARDRICFQSDLIQPAFQEIGLFLSVPLHQAWQLIFSKGEAQSGTMASIKDAD